jgi:hypothetical protein
VWGALKCYVETRRNAMDDFDPYRFDDPVTYAVKTGDISRGASSRDASLTAMDDSSEAEFADSNGRLSTSEAVIGLIMALAFVLVAALSF